MGVAGTATLRSVEKVAAGATVIGAANLVEASSAFSEGRCDALALGRLALHEMERTTRVTEGNFHVAETALIVPMGNDAALEAASALLRRLKADGTVARSFQRHGMAEAVIPEN